jgi:hypothetical protein
VLGALGQGWQRLAARATGTFFRSRGLSLNRPGRNNPPRLASFADDSEEGWLRCRSMKFVAPTSCPHDRPINRRAVSPSLAGSGQGSFPPPALPGLNGSTNPSAICVRRRWPSRVRRWLELSLLTTIADFPCCAPFMFRACCHHCPGGIAGCVSRSLHRRRRPSPLFWRVGSHIGSFEIP